VYDERVNLIREGMSVEDADGDSVGTVKAVFQAVQASSAATSNVAPAGDAYLKVHAGLPLIGKTLYIPASAVRDVADDRVILQIDESRVGEQGWEDRPAWIDE
jgi:hypothetical protein